MHGMCMRSWWQLRRGRGPRRVWTICGRGFAASPEHANSEFLPVGYWG